MATVVLLWSFGAACSGSGGGAPDGGGGAGTGGPATPLTCQQIRLCVAQTPCATAACVQDCASKGAPGAQTTFEALRACTAGVCGADDVACACAQQCLADGACLAEVDACLGNLAADDICDILCH